VADLLIFIECSSVIAAYVITKIIMRALSMVIS